MKKTSSSCYFVCCLCIFAISTTLTVLSSTILSSSYSHAENSTVPASVTVSDFCTLNVDNSSTAHSAELEVGTYTTDIGETVINVSCNDRNGYSVYAVGYSNDTIGNTNLVGTTSNIPTGTSTAIGSNAVSNWAMKLTGVSGTFTPTILNGFDNYHVVPSTATKVATRTSNIDLSADSPIKTTYAVALSLSQAKGSYEGKVKYTVVHPYYTNADGTTESYPVTLSFGTNTTGIIIDGVTYTSLNPTLNLTHGTHAIEGVFPTDYELDAWSVTGNITIVDPSSTPAYITVTGAGTLTVTGKKEVFCKNHATELYCRVASLWEQGGSRVQTDDNDTDTGIFANITIANSGVYKYDANTFGVASDAANTHDIYYYRGVLDSDLDGTDSTYGSNGNGVTWPNYVKLGNTCWRIVRTTGSGGVKMIYNGLYSSGTTSNSCANAQDNAQITNLAFDITANGNSRSILGAGYTHRSSYTTTTTDTAYSTLFGSNSSYSFNSVNSTIKDYIENTWFSNISSYESLLEPSAGFCNDRTMNGSILWDNPMADTAKVKTPYASSYSGNFAYGFGPNKRNWSSSYGYTPTLNCARDRADLYTTSSASDGNNQLSKPVALLTADEITFTGAGNISDHNNAYTHSGSAFWTLSPYDRAADGYVRMFAEYSLNVGFVGPIVSDARGVRPAVSLALGATITGGTGTAVDPWVVAAP